MNASKVKHKYKKTNLIRFLQEAGGERLEREHPMHLFSYFKHLPATRIAAWLFIQQLC